MGFMLPLLANAGASFLPSLLGHLFGGQDPQQKLRQQMQQVLAPANFAKLSGQFYQQNLGSPAYAQGQRDIAGGANMAGNNLQANLGARGVGTSGSGAVLSSLVPSLVGSQMAGLQTGAWNQAQGQAGNNIQQQLAALQQTGGQPSQNQQLFAGGLGAFGPILQQLLQHQYPGIFGPNAGQHATLPQWSLQNALAGYQTPGMANPQTRPS